MPYGRIRRVIRKATPEERARVQEERVRREAAPTPKAPEEVKATLSTIRTSLLEQKAMVRIGDELWRTTREYVPFLRHIPGIGPILSASLITTGRAGSRIFGELAAMKAGSFKSFAGWSKLFTSSAVAVGAILAIVISMLSLSKIFRTLLSTIFMIFSIMMDLFVIPFIPLFMMIYKALLKSFPDVVKASESLKPLIEETAPKIATAFGAIVPPLFNLLSQLIEIVMPIIDLLLPLLAPVVDFVTTILKPFVPFLQDVANMLQPLIPVIADLLRVVADMVVELIGPILKALEPIISTAVDITVELLKMVVDILKIFEPFMPLIASVLALILEVALVPVLEIIKIAVYAVLWPIKWVLDKILGGIEGVKNWVQGVVNTLDTVRERIVGAITGFFGQFKLWQAGTSYVPSTMLGILHRGEAVLPSGVATAWRAGLSGPTISVSNVFNVQPGTVAENLMAGLTLREIFNQNLRMTLARVL